MSDGSSDLAVGLAAVSAAVLLFGLFPLPTKQYKTGDGMFFQLLMACGIFMVGVVTQFVQCSTTHNAGFASLSDSAPSCPQFVPLSASGGAIWALSNVLLVPIVNCIGIGLCMMTWGMAEMFAGWATGRFGLFGVAVEGVSNSSLNFGGVALAFLSLLVLALAQPAVADGTDKEHDGRNSNNNDSREGTEGEKVGLLASMSSEGAGGGAGAGRRKGVSVIVINAGDEGEEETQQRLLDPSTRKASSAEDDASAAAAAAAAAALHFAEHGHDFTHRLTPRSKRIFGIFASLLAGALSGSTFTAPQYVADKNKEWLATHPGEDLSNAPFPGASTALVEHLYSHFSGIFFTSSLMTIIYCAATKNKPWVSAPLMLPSFAAGLTWGLAMVSWFIANQRLSVVVSFPMVTLGPGILNLIIGAVFFREIHGRKNLALLAASTLIYLAASIMIALSNSSA